MSVEAIRFNQRKGRILRQGNEFEKVQIFNYLTEKTFDSYLMQIIVNKAKFINQVMSGKTTGRTCGDVSEVVLNYAEMQALASGDPRIKEKIDLEFEVDRLKILHNGFREEQFKLRDIVKDNAITLAELSDILGLAKTDSETLKKSNGNPLIVLDGKTYDVSREVDTY